MIATGGEWEITHNRKTRFPKESNSTTKIVITAEFKVKFRFFRVFHYLSNISRSDGTPSASKRKIDRSPAFITSGCSACCKNRSAMTSKF